MRFAILPKLRSQLIALFAMAFWATIIVAVSPSRVRAQPKGQPPIIDRELFFGDPEITNAQLSPDGKFIAFIKPFKGTQNVWVKPTAAPFDSAKPLTADESRPIPGYFWTRDGKYILFVQDKAGDQIIWSTPSIRPRARRQAREFRPRET